jgi:protein SCO1/2
MGTPDLQDRSPAENADPTAGQRRQRPRRIDRKMLLPLLAIVVIVGVTAAIVAGTSHNSQPLPAGVHSTKSASFLGSELTPPKAAPGLPLRNYLGGSRIDIAAYRGKAVLVTFLYTHCPDVCPLIAANLGVALNQMGPKVASKVQVIAVSVDPRGDTRQTVTTFMKEHGVTGRMLYLTGSAKELGHVWQQWGVGSERDAQQPAFINHSAVVYGVDGSGRLRTVYIGASWKPSEIAHDVPLLAAQ